MNFVVQFVILKMENEQVNKGYVNIKEHKTCHKNDQKRKNQMILVDSFPFVSKMLMHLIYFENI